MEHAILLSLLTDFGLDSSCVAQLKALLLEEAPGQAFVDISHACPPQDLRAAAWLLYSFVQGLPRRKRLHLCVVDPGVGSARAVLHLRALGQEFLAPDNGLLSYILDLDPRAECCALPAAPEKGSSTFHGRDHFLPLALRRLRGEDLGGGTCNPCSPFSLKPRRVGETWRGAVLFVDGFGNRITALQAEHAGGRPPENLRFVYGDQELPLQRCYADCGPGEPSVILNSTGHFEIALKNGNADKELQEGGDLILQQL